MYVYIYMCVCVYVCMYVCPFIIQDIVDRFRCGFFHWIANSNKSDMGEKKLKKDEKMGQFLRKTYFWVFL